MAFILSGAISIASIAGCFSSKGTTMFSWCACTRPLSALRIGLQTSFNLYGGSTVKGLRAAKSTILPGGRNSSEICAGDDSITAIAVPLPQCDSDFFPNECSTFLSIRQKKQYWKDNTLHIERTVENYCCHQLFLRPPQWGKSLFISMLDRYLDINAKGTFEELFGGTDIYAVKERLRYNNKYYVMLFDLGLDVQIGDPTTVVQRLHDKIELSVQGFCERYGIDFHEHRRQNNPWATLKRVVNHVKWKFEGTVFILIDQNERFANDLMPENAYAYSKIMSAEWKDQWYRTVYELFEAIKSMKRVRSFTVGRRRIDTHGDPIGVNYIGDITNVPAMDDMLGLNDADVRCALTTIFGPKVKVGPLVSLMQRFYHGSFDSADHRTFKATLSLYQTGLCLYFFRRLCRDSGFRANAFAGTVRPEDMMMEEL